MNKSYYPFKVVLNVLYKDIRIGQGFEPPTLRLRGKYINHYSYHTGPHIVASIRIHVRLEDYLINESPFGLTSVTPRIGVAIRGTAGSH